MRKKGLKNPPNAFYPKSLDGPMDWRIVDIGCTQILMVERGMLRSTTHNAYQTPPPPPPRPSAFNEGGGGGRSELVVFGRGPPTNMVPPRQLGPPPPHTKPLTTYPPSELARLPLAHTTLASRRHLSSTQTFPACHISLFTSASHPLTPVLHSSFSTPLTSRHLSLMSPPPVLVSPLPLPPLPLLLPPFLVPASTPPNRFLPHGHRSLVVPCKFAPSTSLHITPAHTLSACHLQHPYWSQKKTCRASRHQD
jgi:hypothetical protein